MKNTEILSKIPLTSEAHNLAQQFASEQVTSQKSKQVYLNSLAVWAVNRFLQWMEINTDLSQGESWNSLVRSFNDVADLFLPSLEGRLECRPVLPGETSIELPPEVREERVGCVAVQFQEQLNEVQLLGYFPVAEIDELPEQIPIKNLSSLNELLNHLEQLEKMKDVNNLRNWLEDIFVKSGWEDDEPALVRANSRVNHRRGQKSETITLNLPEKISFLSEQLHSRDKRKRQEAAAELGQIGTGNTDVITSLTELLEVESDEDIRWQAALSLGKVDPTHPLAGVKKKKLIDLGIDCPPVALIVSYRPEHNNEFSGRIQVYSTASDIYLPTGCKLMLLNEEDQILGTLAEAKDNDYCIQQCFKSDPGDFFRVQVALGKASYIEDFVC